MRDVLLILRKLVDQAPLIGDFEVLTELLEGFFEVGAVLAVRDLLHQLSQAKTLLVLIVLSVVEEFGLVSKTNVVFLA